MERPFRFGIPLAEGGPPADLAEEAKVAEALGYSTLQSFDQLALERSSPIPALAFAAAVTTKIRISSYVLDNGYRHPVVLAKEAVALDQLSGGRLELGIGAGYSEDEYRGSGLAFPPGAERVARLEEAVAILKDLFRDGRVSRARGHYGVDAFTLPAQPVQRPWPPLMLAGARQRLLTLAGREADIVSLAVTSWDFQARGGPGLEDARRKIAWARGAAGPRAGEVEFEILINARFGATRAGAIAEASARTGAPTEVLQDSPYLVAGPPEEIAETLRERRRDLGISYFSVRPRGAMREFARVIHLLA